MRSTQRTLVRRPDCEAIVPPRCAKGGLGDRFEREAREVADRLVGLQTYSSDFLHREVIGSVEPEPSFLGSPGRSLDPATRSSFESRFGHHFSQVRIHTDSRASAAADEVQARAFTLGPHIVFGPGETGRIQRMDSACSLTS
jgi:hypothetical protein